MTRDTCPHCAVSLVGAEIPVDKRESYGGATHWRREIGVELRGGYDGTLFYQCPDCDGVWHRWSVGSPMHAEAERYFASRGVTPA